MWKSLRRELAGRLRTGRARVAGDIHDCGGDIFRSFARQFGAEVVDHGVWSARDYGICLVASLRRLGRLPENLLSQLQSQGAGLALVAVAIFTSFGMDDWCFLDYPVGRADRVVSDLSTWPNASFNQGFAFRCSTWVS